VSDPGQELDLVRLVDGVVGDEAEGCAGEAGGEVLGVGERRRRADRIGRLAGGEILGECARASPPGG